MKAEEIREWSDSEIGDRLRELTEERFKLRFQSAMMQLDDPGLPRRVRKDIARLHTIRRERELAAKQGHSGETNEMKGSES